MESQKEKKKITLFNALFCYFLVNNFNIVSNRYEKQKQ
jgi:hypothetical protein